MSEYLAGVLLAFLIAAVVTAPAAGLFSLFAAFAILSADFPTTEQKRFAHRLLAVTLGSGLTLIFVAPLLAVVAGGD